ncbi:hypothetical protein B296_00018662 [Ensete ventricosum]|uniref:Uncharacterized protein n=1 Tax=Ensete ventricosum TaxID=4639 RepID=A0A427AEF5_ENSVE|nr:hypothetical protein B296_00018662 [Ensete ventricosum]
MATNIVVVFDFDKTIIDCDSDNWVIDHLGGTQLFDELLKTMPWNSAMVCIFAVLDADRMMGEFHSQGRTIEEVAESLRRAPLPANTIAAIKSAYALGYLHTSSAFSIVVVDRHCGFFSDRTLH